MRWRICNKVFNIKVREISGNPCRTRTMTKVPPNPVPIFPTGTWKRHCRWLVGPVRQSQLQLPPTWWRSEPKQTGQSITNTKDTTNAREGLKPWSPSARGGHNDKLGSGSGARGPEPGDFEKKTTGRTSRLLCTELVPMTQVVSTAARRCLPQGGFTEWLWLGK